MAYNVSRNLNFFTRIFTQFFGKFICLLFCGRQDANALFKGSETEDNLNFAMNVL